MRSMLLSLIFLFSPAYAAWGDVWEASLEAALLGHGTSFTAMSGQAACDAGPPYVISHFYKIVEDGTWDEQSGYFFEQFCDICTLAASNNPSLVARCLDLLSTLIERARLQGDAIEASALDAVERIRCVCPTHADRCEAIIQGSA